MGTTFSRKTCRLDINAFFSKFASTISLACSSLGITSLGMVELEILRIYVRNLNNLIILFKKKLSIKITAIKLNVIKYSYIRAIKDPVTHNYGN